MATLLHDPRPRRTHHRRSLLPALLQAKLLKLHECVEPPKFTKVLLRKEFRDFADEASRTRLSLTFMDARQRRSARLLDLTRWRCGLFQPEMGPGGEVLSEDFGLVLVQSNERDTGTPMREVYFLLALLEMMWPTQVGCHISTTHQMGGSTMLMQVSVAALHEAESREVKKAGTPAMVSSYFITPPRAMLFPQSTRVLRSVPVNLNFWKLCTLSLTASDYEAMIRFMRSGEMPLEQWIATQTAARAITQGIVLVSGAAYAHFRSLEPEESQGFLQGVCVAKVLNRSTVMA